MFVAGHPRPGRADSGSGHVRCTAHHAAARSPLSVPRATIIKSASGNRLRGALSRGACLCQPVLGFRQLPDVIRRVAQHHRRFPARQFDRIEKSLVPWHRSCHARRTMSEINRSRPNFALQQNDVKCQGRHRHNQANSCRRWPSPVSSLDCPRAQEVSGMFRWFRRSSPPPTEQQLRVRQALAAYPPYMPPKWNGDPDSFVEASNEYREFFLGSRERRLEAFRSFLANFDVSLKLDDDGLLAVSNWLPQYADLLIDDLDGDLVQDAYQGFTLPWTETLSGLNPIFDLGVYYAECLWYRRKKLEWIVYRAPDRGLRSTAFRVSLADGYLIRCTGPMLSAETFATQRCGRKGECQATRTRGF
jgi:hypothetical protein